MIFGNSETGIENGKPHRHLISVDPALSVAERFKLTEEELIEKDQAIEVKNGGDPLTLIPFPGDRLEVSIRSLQENAAYITGILFQTRGEEALDSVAILLLAEPVSIDQTEPRYSS